MEDPLWRYYDEIEDKVCPIPGDINLPPPRPPKKEWDSQEGKEYYHFFNQERK